eukprot:GHVU01108467.1.p2 GENE.GHVU01108467.1~~GHVU01108467.1.p2  ORF type:complete len:164 (+),score=4.81 GHVU01108467.1:95-586(+)
MRIPYLRYFLGGPARGSSNQPNSHLEDYVLHESAERGSFNLNKVVGPEYHTSFRENTDSVYHCTESNCTESTDSSSSRMAAPRMVSLVPIQNPSRRTRQEKQDIVINKLFFCGSAVKLVTVGDQVTRPRDARPEQVPVSQRQCRRRDDVSVVFHRPAMSAFTG